MQRRGCATVYFVGNILSPKFHGMLNTISKFVSIDVDNTVSTKYANYVCQVYLRLPSLLHQFISKHYVIDRYVKNKE